MKRRKILRHSKFASRYYCHSGSFIEKIMGKPEKVEKLLRPCFDELDIVGLNYAEDCYEPHHKHDPMRIMVGSETYPHSMAKRWPHY